jgi:hypothetical protein
MRLAAASALLSSLGCGKEVPIGATSDDGGATGGDHQIFVSDQWAAQSLAVDQDNLYWIRQDGWSCADSGSIVKVSKGGGTPVVLATGQDCPLGIAANGTDVFWTNNLAAGSVSKVSSQGGPTVVLAANRNYPAGIAANGTDVFWVDGAPFGSAALVPSGPLVRAAVDGGTPTVLVDVVSPRDVAIDSTHVYFTSRGGQYVEKVPLGGGAPVPLASSPDGYIFGAIAVGGTGVYAIPALYGNLDDCNPAKISLAGGPPIILGGAVSTQCSNFSVSGVATDGVNVYWTEADASGDADVIDLNNGFVKKVSANDGVPVTLAAGSSFTSIVVDDTSVYWVDEFHGAIYKTAK